MAGIKIRRVDLYSDDALTGTTELTDDEMGVYVRVWLLMYATGAPITIEKLRSVCKSHGTRFKSIISRLETLGKVMINGQRITCKRCEKEIQRALNRLVKASQNGSKGGRPNGLAKADGFGQDNPTSLSSLQQPTEEKETRASRASSNEAFDRWWEGYPEKVGKGAAKRAFLKALSKTSLDQLIGGVERYKAAKPPDRPWCNPATWLNQERWLDVPATNGVDTAELSFGGPPTEPPPIPEGGFFPVGRDH